MMGHRGSKYFKPRPKKKKKVISRDGISSMCLELKGRLTVFLKFFVDDNLYKNAFWHES